MDEVMQRCMRGEVVVEMDHESVYTLTNEYVEPGQWRAGLCVCRVCEDQKMHFWPVAIFDDTMQQCDNCGAMSCEPVCYTDED